MRHIFEVLCDSYIINIILSIASSLDHFTDQFQEIEVVTEIPQLGILEATSGFELNRKFSLTVLESLFSLVLVSLEITKGFLVDILLEIFSLVDQETDSWNLYF